MKKVLGWLVLAAVGIGLIALIAVRVLAAREARVEEAPAEAPPVSVTVATAARRDLAERVMLTGVIRPAAELDIIAKVPGRIESIAVKVGDKVKPGDLLAVIEHKTLELQAAQAAAAVAGASAALDSAKVGLDSAKTNHERFKGLLAEKAIPLAEFEKVESGVKGAESGVKAAEANLAMARAAAGLAAEALRNSKVFSPIAGTITKRLIEVGSEAAPGRPLFQVQDVSALELEGAVVAADFARLSVGATASIGVEDIPGVTFAAKVATMSPTLDPMTRRALVEITVDNSEGKLLPNMFASAVVDVGMREDALCIPRSAVVAQAGSVVVYKVKGGKVTVVRPTLGAGDVDYVAVESGLSEGDEVVTSGHTGLGDGVKVVVAKPTSTAAAAAPEAAARPEVGAERTTAK